MPECCPKCGQNFWELDDISLHCIYDGYVVYINNKMMTAILNGELDKAKCVKNN